MAKLFSVVDFPKSVESDYFSNFLKKLYGDEQEIISSQKDRYNRLYKLFKDKYPHHKNFRIFTAPGRTEIAGNHTDHQGGNVLCASVDLDVIAFAAPNNDNMIRVQSEFYDKFDQINLDNLSPVPEETGKSASLIRGVASGFNADKLFIGGFDAYTTSNVPSGSGLSSSAAFEILISTTLNYLYNDGTVKPLAMAKISQGAENNFFGKPSGLMDQCGCAFGGMMTIDFKDNKNVKVEHLEVDFNSFGYTPVITDTKGDHSDLTGDYAAITIDMREVANYFGKSLLSEVGFEDFNSNLAALSSKVGIGPTLRAMHFFQDDKRVTLQTNALKNSDINEFLKLVNQSGISSWTLLRNIYSPAHPQNMQLALALAATGSYLGEKGACRVHGGGFAGTIQAFVPNNMVDGYIKLMDNLFGKGSSRKIHIRDFPATEIDRI